MSTGFWVLWTLTALAAAAGFVQVVVQAWDEWRLERDENRFWEALERMDDR